MAFDKPHSPLRATQFGLVEMVAKCVGAGSSDPTALEGDATSVSRSATGTYVVTFPGATLDVRDVHVSIRQAASKDLFHTFTYDESAGTVTVTVKNGAASFADIDLTTDETLHVRVLVKVTRLA